jgi:hypothetical protein
MSDNLDDFGDASHNSLIDILGSWFRGPTLKEEAIKVCGISSSG